MNFPDKRVVLFLNIGVLFGTFGHFSEKKTAGTNITLWQY